MSIDNKTNISFEDEFLGQQDQSQVSQQPPQIVEVGLKPIQDLGTTPDSNTADEGLNDTEVTKNKIAVEKLLNEIEEDYLDYGDFERAEKMLEKLFNNDGGKYPRYCWNANPRVYWIMLKLQNKVQTKDTEFPFSDKAIFMAKNPLFLLTALNVARMGKACPKTLKQAVEKICNAINANNSVNQMLKYQATYLQNRYQMDLTIKKEGEITNLIDEIDDHVVCGNFDKANELLSVIMDNEQAFKRNLWHRNPRIFWAKLKCEHSFYRGQQLIEKTTQVMSQVVFDVELGKFMLNGAPIVANRDFLMIERKFRYKDNQKGFQYITKTIEAIWKLVNDKKIKDTNAYNTKKANERRAYEQSQIQSVDTSGNVDASKIISARQQDLDEVLFQTELDIESNTKRGREFIARARQRLADTQARLKKVRSENESTFINTKRKWNEQISTLQNKIAQAQREIDQINKFLASSQGSMPPVTTEKPVVAEEKQLKNAEFLREIKRLCQEALNDDELVNEIIDLINNIDNDDELFEKAEELHNKNERDKSFPLFKYIAEKGHAEAQYYVGECYYCGDGVTQDYKEAVKWFTKSAEQGNADAQYALGFCYQYGEGVEKNTQTAIKWYQLAAEQGHLVAEQCHQDAIDALDDLDATDDEDIDGLFKKALALYDNKKYTEAFPLLKELAEQGHAGAQNHLAICYECGQGVSRDYRKALEWYKKAAENDNAEAQYTLGYCLLNGAIDEPTMIIGKIREICDYIPRNQEKAVYWLKKSAEQGHAGGQFELGYAYGWGFGVKKDYKKAIYWLNKAVENGDAQAQYFLGCRYDMGDWGVAKDQQKAIYWYKKAAEQGYEPAKKLLSELNSKNTFNVCPRCGSSNALSTEFCSSCGTKLKVPEVVVCRRCNTQNSSMANFCRNCGSPLNVGKK